VNLIKIYCKHICKYHNVSPVQQLYANKIILKGVSSHKLVPWQTGGGVTEEVMVRA
jgi:hypothetical protein